jgi:hypothetical protein
MVSGRFCSIRAAKDDTLHPFFAINQERPTGPIRYFRLSANFLSGAEYSVKSPSTG